MELFDKKRRTYSFIGIWLVISIAYLIISLWVIKHPLTYSILDSIITNFSFCILSVYIWYISKFYSKNRKIYQIVFSHTAISIFTVSAWVYLCNLCLSNIFEANEHFIKIRYGLGIFYYSIVVLLYYNLYYYERIQEKRQNELKLSSLLKDSQYKALKSQINPHFLFNSLNSISSLTISNPEKAQEMIIKLSDFLRLSLNYTQLQSIELKSVIENMENYIEIEKIRFGEKLNLITSVDQNSLGIKIPTMLIQPLIENSIKHGISQLTKKSNIIFSVQIKKEILEIYIENEFDPSYKALKSSGIGLKNIRERLRNIYNQNNLIEVSRQESIFKVKVTIPINNKLT